MTKGFSRMMKYSKVDYGNYGGLHKWKFINFLSRFELYLYDEWISWYENYTSIKLLQSG